MERRDFAKLLAGGAIGWLVGSPGGTTADAAGYPNPVEITADLTRFDAADLARLRKIDSAATASRSSSTFPQSVASGDPQAHGIVLWTRVPALSLTTRGGQLILWQIASAEDFHDGSILLEGAATINPARDGTVKLPIHHRVLKPYSTYYYRFVYDRVATKTGRFKTLPAKDDDNTKLRMAFVTCQDFSNGYYNALYHLASEDIDVVLHLGDYIYEYRDDGVGGPNGGPVRTIPPFPSGAAYPSSLADYRHLWQHYRADPNQRKAHERFAYIQLWDDHEFFNDCHQDFHEDTLPTGATAQTPFPALRQSANQAWCEYALADVTFDPTKDWSASVQPHVYRTFHFGKLMELIVTDQRLYRDGPPCGDVSVGERYQTKGCANQFNPARTMLGATQKAWFLDKVTNSKATWKLWANEVMLAQYLLATPAAGVFFFDLDQWDGYPAERASILSAIGAAGVQNFVALTGDAHLFQAAYLKPDFNNAASKPVGVELVVGAISSGNYLDAGVDQPAPFVPAKSAPQGGLTAAATGLPMDALAPVVLQLNPHTKFWNGSTWGYGLLNITKEEIFCTFRAIETVKQPASPIENLAKFRLPAGRVQIIPA